MIYGDLYLLINTLCDLAALYLTALLNGKRASAARLLSGALTGGAYALIHLYIARFRAPDLILSVLTSLLMVFIVFFPDSPRALLRALLCFYTVCLILGGGVTALSGALGDRLRSPAAALTALIALFLLFTGAAAVGWKLIDRRRTRKRVEIRLTVGGETLSFDGLIDSGCLLRDALTGLPVIILSEDLFSGRAPVCARAVTVRMVCSAAALPCFLPDALRLNGRSARALLALSPAGTSFGGRPALVPESILL